jgi:hypothetical protein
MSRKQREAEQQAEQIGEDHPLVRHVERQPAQARPGLEAGEAELVQRDDGEARQCHLERVVMKQRHAGQSEAEEHEVDWHAQHAGHHRRRDGECE